MTNINNKPFLLLLEQAANQTDDFRAFEALLKKQQDEFKEFVEEYFYSDLSAHKRFYFLSNVIHDLWRIRKEYAAKIRETDATFYRFWALLIDETKHFAGIGIKTLQFQKKCPAHMLADEQVRTFPQCNWTAQRSDLMEAIVGLYHADIIRMQDGSRPSFTEFAKEIGNVFGITFNNPKSEMDRILDRRKNQTPFLNRMVCVLKKKCEDSLA